MEESENIDSACFQGKLKRSNLSFISFLNLASLRTESVGSNSLHLALHRSSEVNSYGSDM